VEAMQARIRRSNGRAPWLVFEAEDEVGGYAYATRWRARAAVSVFGCRPRYILAPRFKGEESGQKLYGKLT